MSTYSFVIPVLNEEGVIAELHRRLAAVADQLDGQLRVRARRRRQHRPQPRVDARPAACRSAGEVDLPVAKLRSSAGDHRRPRLRLGGRRGDDGRRPPGSPRGGARDGGAVARGLGGRPRGPHRAPGRGSLQALDRDTASTVSCGAFSKIDLPLDAGDFRLVDRRVADVVRGMREPDRYLRGLFAWAGYRQTSVSYERSERHSGETKYSLSNMVGFAIDGLLSFSVAPLRIVIGDRLRDLDWSRWGSPWSRRCSS